MHKASQAYFQTQLTTVNQGELLLLLYDGALKFLAQAKEKIVAKDYAAKGILISRALDIINELDSSLNEKEGGDLARNLHSLYFTCSTRLLQANLRMDADILDTVTNILSGLRSAYAQILSKPDARAAAAQIAAKQPPTAATIQRAVPLPSAGLSAPGLGRTQARAAYGQQTPQSALSAPLQAAPAASAASPADPAPAADAPAMQAPEKAPEQVSGQAGGQAAPPLGLLNRRLAASTRYGKMSGL